MDRIPVASFNVALLQGFAAVYRYFKSKGMLATLTLEQLDMQLNSQQREIVQQILALKPEDYGVQTPYLGLEPVPTELITIKAQRVKLDGSWHIMQDKFLPGPVYDAFQNMSASFTVTHPSRKLLVESGYRSPALQVLTFANWCGETYKGDIAQAIRHVSPPAYSQHTSSTHTAVDLMNIDGKPSHNNPEDFKKTIEYAWLQEHAARFKFYESWPENNSYNMRPEPWHWHYKP